MSLILLHHLLFLLDLRPDGSSYGAKSHARIRIRYGFRHEETA
jgi:hypothetical protein